MLLKFKYLHWITLKRSTCRINTWGSLVAVGPFPGLQRSTLQTWPVCSSAWDGSAQTFTLSHWSPLVWHRGFSFCILSKKVLIISHTTCTQLTKMFISRPRVAGAGTNKLKCQKNIQQAHTWPNCPPECQIWTIFWTLITLARMAKIEKFLWPSSSQWAEDSGEKKVF